jgi:hypothetical protein
MQWSASQSVKFKSHTYGPVADSLILLLALSRSAIGRSINGRLVVSIGRGRHDVGSGNLGSDGRLIDFEPRSGEDRMRELRLSGEWQQI